MNRKYYRKYKKSFLKFIHIDAIGDENMDVKYFINTNRIIGNNFII